MWIKMRTSSRVRVPANEVRDSMLPVLWDKEQSKVVSNESPEISRLFSSALNGLTDNTLNFYPVRVKRQNRRSKCVRL
jgi:glutathionyl-hydroquinone reductase